MSTIESATDVVKFHISLNTSDLARSLAFYRILFGQEPAKVRDDYAKFELAEPPVILSLIPVPPTSGGFVNHVGLRLLDSAALVAVQLRLEQAGFATEREDGVECCYSKQTKFWVHDPDGALWELYVLHGDADEHDHESPTSVNGLTGSSTFRGAIAASHSSPGSAPTAPCSVAAPCTATKPESVAWQHMLTQPIPERLDFADGTVDDVQLQGTLNMKLEPERVLALLREVHRALRPGGTIGAHVLTSDHPLATRPTLPGPASLVEHVWTETEAAGFLADAGFIGIRFTKLSAKPCFTVGDTQLRETKLAATKAPAESSAGEMVEVLYRGPLKELHDDFGNVFSRGKRLRVATTVAAQLAAILHADEMFSFGEKPTGDGGCG